MKNTGWRFTFVIEDTESNETYTKVNEKPQWMVENYSQAVKDAVEEETFFLGATEIIKSMECEECVIGE